MKTSSDSYDFELNKHLYWRNLSKTCLLLFNFQFSVRVFFCDTFAIRYLWGFCQCLKDDSKSMSTEFPLQMKILMSANLSTIVWWPDLSQNSHFDSFISLDYFSKETIYLLHVWRCGYKLSFMSLALSGSSFNLSKSAYNFITC